MPGFVFATCGGGERAGDQDSATSGAAGVVDVGREDGWFGLHGGAFSLWVGSWVGPFYLVSCQYRLLTFESSYEVA